MLPNSEADLSPEKKELLAKLRSISVVFEDHWLCQSMNQRGHGQLRYKGRSHGAHRLSAHIFYDMELEDKVQVNHHVLCFFRNCWNPNHLYLGDQSQNLQDAVMAGSYNNQNTVKTHCKNGHLLPEADSTGSRRCPICIAEYQRTYNATRRNKTTNNT